MLLILGIISFVAAALGVVWFARTFTKDKNPTERADLNRTGSILFTLVSLVVGGAALLLYFTGYPGSASQLDGVDVALYLWI